jgi:hypothetical protein
VKDFVKKLALIQLKLNAPKSQRNNFGNYNYRSCEDILQAVKPLLGDMVITIEDDISLIADRVYVKATASITDGENTIKTTAFARETLSKKGQDEAQTTGSASSYARKYALNGLLLIDDNKDADTQDNSDRMPQSAPTITPEEAAKILNGSANMNELKANWGKVPVAIRNDVEHVKDRKKEELSRR